MTKEYKLERFSDIADIPPEAFERFMEELHDMYDRMRQCAAIAESCGLERDALIKKLSCKDDGDNHMDIELYGCDNELIETVRLKGD